MVARRDFTVRSGPLAGQHFMTETQYQNARARNLGFTSYSQQRRETGIGNPQARVMIERAVQRGGMSREDARREVRAWFQTQSFKGRGPGPRAAHTAAHGRRKSAAMTWLGERGWLTDDRDVDIDEIPY